MRNTIQTITKSMLLTALGVSLLAPSALAESSQVIVVPYQQQNPAAKVSNPANAKISKEQAVEITRKLIPGLKDASMRSIDYGRPNVYPQSSEDIWTIQWEMKTANGSMGFSSTVDAINGDLLQVYLPTYNNNERNDVYYPPKVTKDEAESLAKAFIAKAAPSVAIDSLAINEDMPYMAPTSLFGPVQYNFQFYLKMNGVPYRDGGISVTMDGDGHVTMFNKSQQIGDFPSAEPTITMEQAVKFAQEHQQLELQYIPVRYGGSKVESWWLGYMPRLQPIDAQTGQFVTLDAVPYQMGSTYIPVPRSDNATTPFPGNEELTAEQAAQIVEQAIPSLKDKKLLQKSLQNGWREENQKVWSLNWGDEEQGMMPYGPTRATVDARTGVILEYWSNSYGPFTPASKPGTTEPAVSEEEAVRRAEAFINAAYPNASEDLKRLETINTGKQQSYFFKFSRFYKGVPLVGEDVNVTLDLQGNVIQYYGNRSTLNEQVLNALKVNISKDEALKRVWENTKIELQYHSYGGYPSDSPEPPKVKLVYNQSLKNNISFRALDASDGTWKPTWSGQPDMTPPAGEPTDITGHWAQKDLETMVLYKVLTMDNAGKLNPDQSIKYGDWLIMMASAYSPYYKNYYGGNTDGMTFFADIREDSPYFNAIRLFVQMKWLTADANKKLEADQEITRESLASSLVGIVKYSKLSSLLASHLTVPSFTDSDQIVNKSDVALAVYLGLMTGTDGAFRPQDKVTKAEAASVIMRLVQLQGKLDQPIGQ